MIEKLRQEESIKLEQTLSEARKNYHLQEKKMESLNTEKEELTKEVEKIAFEKRPKKGSYSLISRIFLNKYKKEYKRVLEENKEKDLESSKINSRLNEIEKEINNCQTEIDRLKIELEEAGKIDGITVEYLLGKHPELAFDKEFMREAIKMSPNYIAFDKTNDKEVYKDLIMFLKSNVSKELFEGYNPDFPQEIIEKFDDIIKEIDSPAEVDEGRYKIQNRYLFESIKKCSDKGHIKKCSSDEKLIRGWIENTFYVVEKYFSLNGIISNELGSTMAKIWDNPDTLAAVHGFNRGMERWPEECDEEQLNGIIENGLRATNAMGEMNRPNANPYILATAMVQDYTDLTFLDFVDYHYSGSRGYVVFEIPRAGVGRNANIPIWGINEDTSERQGKAYLKPEYTVGYVLNYNGIKPEDYKLVIKNATTKKYKYSLMDATYSATGKTIYSENEDGKNIKR
jgi:hypothetical protein